MAEHELDALVVRAPDNVLYLTNFWGMKGYDACVFPREGEPVLICLEASEEDADRMSWTKDVRFVQRLRARRSAAGARAHARRGARSDEGLRHVGLELSMGTQATDRMVGEPTTFTKGWFDAWPDAHDAMSVLVPARSIKTDAGDRADAARERDLRRRDGARARADQARDEGERGRCALAGLRARPGHRLAGQGRAGVRLLARSGPAAGSRRSRRRATCRWSRASRRCSRSGSAPTATGATTRSCSASASCAPTTACSRRA